MLISICQIAARSGRLDSRLFGAETVPIRGSATAVISVGVWPQLKAGPVGPRRHRSARLVPVAVALQPETASIAVLPDRERGRWPRLVVSARRRQPAAFVVAIGGCLEREAGSTSLLGAPVVAVAARVSARLKPVRAPVILPWRQVVAARTLIEPGPPRFQFTPYTGREAGGIRAEGPWSVLRARVSPLRLARFRSLRLARIRSLRLVRIRSLRPPPVATTGGGVT
ncbi:MAG TPA: hypothetical protein VLM11_12200 [Streptosporangiaceae bacterium]|nr:hypothetical protein [Streptosporangiaceae bacterium]